MRLTIAIRDAIVKDALGKKFTAPVAALQKRRTALADTIYGKAIGTPPSTDREWVSYSDSIAISHSGYEDYTWRYRDKRGTLEYEIINLLNSDFKMSTERPVPRKMIYRSNGEIVVKEVCVKTAKALDKLYEDITTLRGDYEELESDLRNLLNSVTTFKQLEAAWPEGKALYDKHKPKPRTTSVVDAGLAVKLTQALTPPLGARP